MTVEFTGGPWRRLDPALAELLKADLAEHATAVGKQIEALQRDPDRLNPIDVYEIVAIGIEQFIAELGHPEVVSDREPFRAHGRAHYDIGRSLPDMLRDYHLSGLATWRSFTARLDREAASPQALTGLAEALFAFVAEISGAAADGYGEARSAAARASEARRRRLLDVLLAEPPSSQSALDQAAREADWKLPSRIAVAVAPREIRERLERLPLTVLVAERDQQVCLVFPADRLKASAMSRFAQLVGDQPAGIGPVVPLSQAPLSLRRARSALALAETETGPVRVVRSDDRATDLLLTLDPELARELSDRVLAPLDELPPDTRDRLTETLTAWLAEPDRPLAIGRRLHVHVQTVRYRARQLRELFGDRMDDPDGRFELTVALRIRRLLS
ncbi:PucR family transcriptional regulator [Nocardioides speluncae]|uniref:PucR family transcriptional regulator n=1 Tax=Nocardioides speluncae TaxID=2670337 RepID=UPI000D68F0EB|nr:helix-turn-helix domain-containing protein [Nocardioides speluncae]